MSFKVFEQAPGRVIEIHVTGILSPEAYQKFLPITEARIAEFGRVRMLVVLDDFHGWDLRALWQDIKFDLKHHGHFERIAIVGDAMWEQGMATFCRPFTSAEIRYFDRARIADARNWVQADLAQTIVWPEWKSSV